jgi:hypothetical protein
MSSRKHALLALFLPLLLATPAVSAPANPAATPTGLTQAQIDAVRADSQKHRTEFFTQQAGKPLVRGRIIKDWNNRGDYTRTYAQSIVLFAMRCFQLDEQNAEANAALEELCRYHLERPQTFLEIHSFPTAFDTLVRLCKFYGPKGSLAPGRITPATYAVLLQTMWEWSKVKAKIADAETEQSQTWWIENSENHHALHFTTCWGFAMILKDESAYRDRKYDDGHTAAEHYAAWTRYIREWLRQRAARGMTVEIDSPSYASATLRGVYSYYDFSDDPVLKKNAGQFLDLYWTLWAEQQIAGVHGGAKARTYPESAKGGTDFMRRIAWYFLGIGEPKFQHSEMIAIATTTWQMPDLVIDLALDVAGRGAYEVKQRRPGLAFPGYSTPPHYRLIPDSAGLVRYGYCHPDFIMGSLQMEARPADDWSAISSQNRWSGVIFRGAEDARVFPQAVSKEGESVYNGFWTVQSGGALVAQKLKLSKNADEWRVWFSKSGMTKPEKQGDWYFAEAPNAYVAVRVVRGGAQFSDEEKPKPGTWLKCEDDFSPVIIEVASKSQMSSAAFREAMAARPLTLEKNWLRYTSLGGKVLALDLEQKQKPEIDGHAIELAPALVYESPFVTSRWNSAIVSIQKGARKLALDFNY